MYYLIESKVEPQCCDVACLTATVNVSQLQLEVVPLSICHLNLIQPQTHWSGRTAGHREHQLTTYHLKEKEEHEHMHTHNEKNRRKRGRV